MTTPRVTVPVEPTPLSVCRAVAPYLGAVDQSDWRGLDDDDAISMPVKMRVGDLRDLKAVISAAPAPEGVAVDGPWSWLTAYAEGDGDPAGREYNCDDMVAAWRAGCAALATREEAPAGAGRAPEPPAHLSSEAAYGWSCGYEAALRAQPPVREDAQPVAWPEKWSGPCTVGNMIANLRTLPPEMPIYTAHHIPMGEGSRLKVKRPTLSRERVDGTNIKTGDESVPYSAVIWTQPRDFTEVSHPAPDAGGGGGIGASERPRPTDAHLCGHRPSPRRRGEVMGTIRVFDAKSGEETLIERDVHVAETRHYPGVECRDSETGEVIFPGKRLMVVPNPSDKEGGV